MASDDVRAVSREAAALLRDETPLREIWRHCMLQLLDDYRSVLRHDGVRAASALLPTHPS